MDLKEQILEAIRAALDVNNDNKVDYQDALEIISRVAVMLALKAKEQKNDQNNAG